MGTAYTRTDTADNIADGNVINASDLDGEFNALQAAFDGGSGHTHDGTAGEGAPIEKIGPNQEIVITTSLIRPAADNTIDLGVANTNEFKDLYIDGTAYLDSVDIDGGSVTGLTELTVDNISLNGSIITTTNTNGNLNLRANGTGIISVDATDVNFGDSDKATFGDSADLSIFHDGSNSYIQDTGTGNLNVKTNVFRVYNAAGDEIMANFAQDAAASLYYNNGVKIATTNTGVSVTGDVAASDDIHLTSDSAKITFGADSEVELYHNADSGLTVSHTSTADDVVTALTIRSNQATLTNGEAIGRLDFTTNTSAGSVANGIQARINIEATATYSATLAGSQMEFSTTKADGSLSRSMYIDDEQNAHLDDDNKLIFGTGSDLQIYHDGSHSYINESGTGNLRILAETFTVRNPANNESMLVATPDAGVVLYYNNASKLATTATGIDVTGGFTATDGSTITTADNTIQLELISTDADNLSGSILSLYRNSASPADDDNVGQLEFHGKNDANQKVLYADIQAVVDDVTDGTEDGSLKIRTAGDGGFRNRMDFGPTEIRVNASSVDLDFRIQSDTLTHAFFVQGSDGNVGINKASPATALDVTGSITASGSVNVGDDLNITGATPTILLTDNDTSDENTRIQNASGSTFIDSRNGNNNGAIVFRGNGGGVNDEYMRIDADGQVGISFDDPQHKLDVSGTGRFVKTNNTQNLILETTDTDASAGPVLELYRNPGQAGAVSDSLGEIKFEGLNAASEKTQFAEIVTSIKDPTDGSEDGRLQINLRIAGANSQVISADGASGEVVINESSQNIDFRVESNGDTHGFFVEGSTGNVGMSVSDPDSHTPQTNNPDKRSFVSSFSGGSQFVCGRSDTSVAADNYIGGYLFKTNDTSGDKFGGMIGKVDDNTGNGILEFFPVTDTYDSSDSIEGVMQLGDSNDLFLRAGGIKVGRSEKTVYTSTEEAIIIYHSGGGTGDSFTSITSRDGTAGDTVFRHQRRGVVKSEIEENGDFQSATISYGGVSDERLKENIVAASSQWDDIKSLQFKNYSMIDAELDAPNMLGVMAQDLQASGMGGLVKQTFKTNADDEPVLDADGNQEEYLSVKYSVLYMKAVKALQEAMTKIETLETKVAALEAE